MVSLFFVISYSPSVHLTIFIYFLIYNSLISLSFVILSIIFTSPMLLPFILSFIHIFSSFLSFQSSSPLSIILTILVLSSPFFPLSIIRFNAGEHLWPSLGGSNVDHRVLIRLCRVRVPPPLSPRHQHGSEER